MKGGETLNMKSRMRMKIPMIQVGKEGLGGTMIEEGDMVASLFSMTLALIMATSISL